MTIYFPANFSNMISPLANVVMNNCNVTLNVALHLSDSPVKLGRVLLKGSQLSLSNLVKYRGREIGLKDYLMALEFDGRLRSSTSEPPVKCQSHPTSHIDLVASRLDKI